MKQEQFERANEALWEGLEATLDRRGQWSRQTTADLERFPGDYRRVCGHYAIALERGYSPRLTTRLQRLVNRAHHRIYRRKTSAARATAEFFTRAFPRMLARHRRKHWLAFALFFGSGIAMGVGCFLDDTLIYSVMNPGAVADMEAMYAPDSARVGRAPKRDAESDFMMFGYYIFNNISIGFRTFASGILVGVGTVFTLLYNGVSIGAVAGHLTRVGYSDKFWTFVCGHGAFELTAIAICGAAGLVLADAVLAPGRRTRMAALRSAGGDAAVLVVGAAVMLAIAAFIEAFWSARASLPGPLKFGVAALLWASVGVYMRPLFPGFEPKAPGDGS